MFDIGLAEVINYKGKIITNKRLDRSDKYDNGKPIYLFTLNSTNGVDQGFS